MWCSLGLCLVGCLASIHASQNMPKAIMSITMCDAQLSHMNGDYKMRPSTPATNMLVAEAAGRSSRRRSKRSTGCDDNIEIDGRTFRSANSRCNNLANPEYGEAFEKFRRFVDARYEDNECLSRASSVNGGPLPSPRDASIAIHSNRTAFEDLNVLVMLWGAFMDHDMAAAATEQPQDNQLCCSDPEVLAGNPHPDESTCGGACSPIRVTDSGINTICMENVRSRSIQDINDISATNKREQQNLVTAFMDGSQIYGSEEERITFLRNGNTPFMRVSANNLLPEGLSTDCILSAESPFCFAAGDERVHVFTPVIGLHTIFVRLHNQIAAVLNTNAAYSDNRVFYETRKIIGALLQEITYFQWLPLILNRRTRRQWGLFRNQYRQENEYSPFLDPSISGAFATAAFRFGHSFIPDELVVAGETILSRSMFNNPNLIFRPDGTLNVLDAVLIQRALRRDRFLTGEITNHLFESPTGQVFDLASLNILRGRDHGLGTYNDARDACNLGRITSFDPRVFADEGAAALAATYNSVDDIDLFTGAMSERNMIGARLGPTFSCILGEQFRNLRYGDRFWYETREQGLEFNREQIREIRRYTLDQILCHTVNFVDVPQKLFDLPGASNPRVACAGRRSLAEILQPWL